MPLQNEPSITDSHSLPVSSLQPLLSPKTSHLIVQIPPNIPIDIATINTLPTELLHHIFSPCAAAAPHRPVPTFAHPSTNDEDTAAEEAASKGEIFRINSKPVYDDDEADEVCTSLLAQASLSLTCSGMMGKLGGWGWGW